MTRQRKKYGLPAVERIELSERGFSARTALAIAATVLALILLAVAVRGLLAPVTGWRTIESDGSRGIHCGGDFVFAVDARGAAQVKRLTLAYTEATAKAQRLFTIDAIDAVEPNLAYLNAHPGENVHVDPALYQALRTACEGGRYLFLAPVYDVHRSLCGCQGDWETADFDPLQREEVAAFCAEAAAYARDAASVDLIFTQPDTVRLELSDAYAAFLAENGCPAAVDFGWMKNAYILDVLADAVLSAGADRASIASVDGFTRTLGDAAQGEPWAVKLYELREGRAFLSGALRFSGSAAVASLRSFPATDGDRSYYVFAGGDIRAPHIDPADGLARAALPSLTGASSDLGCGALLARLLPVYIAEDFVPEAGEGIALIYPEGATWTSTAPDFTPVPPER